METSERKFWTFKIPDNFQKKISTQRNESCQKFRYFHTKFETYVEFKKVTLPKFS